MRWQPDRLLPGYECLEIPLPDEPTVMGEPEGSLRAVLVRGGMPRNRRAVLYLHGWNDYFFHTHVADFFARCGIDFYAIELRRYGRSLVEGHQAGYVASLTDYYVELDAALALLRQDHDRISVIGHSTGGLTAALWVADRPGQFETLILNAPWLAMDATAALQAVTKQLFAGLATANPLYPIRTAEGFYDRTLHVSLDGEWNYDHTYKANPAFRIRVGWCHAILSGQERIASGLGVGCPTMVVMSDRHDPSRTWNESLTRADIVLDVDRIATRVPGLGQHVTLVRIPNAKHDVFLSHPEVRDHAFAEVKRWLGAYFPTGSDSHSPAPYEALLID